MENKGNKSKLDTVEIYPIYDEWFKSKLSRLYDSFLNLWKGINLHWLLLPLYANMHYDSLWLLRASSLDPQMMSSVSIITQCPFKYFVIYNAILINFELCSRCLYSTALTFCYTLPCENYFNSLLDIFYSCNDFFCLDLKIYKLNVKIFDLQNKRYVF